MRYTVTAMTFECYNSAFKVDPNEFMNRINNLYSP